MLIFVNFTLIIAISLFIAKYFTSISEFEKILSLYLTISLFIIAIIFNSEANSLTIGGILFLFQFITTLFLLNRQK
jgi:hypothetical protein